MTWRKTANLFFTSFYRIAQSLFHPKSFRPNSESFRPNSEFFRPNLKLFRPDQNKTSTVETLFTPKTMGGLLSSVDYLSADSVWLCCHASATTLLLIYARNQTNTFGLNGSLTTQMFNKKVKITFHTLQMEAVEGFVKFYEYDRSPINRRRIINIALGEGGRDWGEWNEQFNRT